MAQYRRFRSLKNKARIKWYIQKQGFKQADIAEAAGVTRSFVSEVIRGRKTSEHVISIMIDRFGIPERLLRTPLAPLDRGES